MKRTFLVRHGTPTDVVGRCIGHCDVSLSENGREEMRRLASSFPSPAQRILSSDLTRAAESARVLSAAMCIPVITDPRLREMDFGDWDGRRWDDIHATDAAALSQWSRDFVNVSPPGGESLAKLAARVVVWLNDPMTVRSEGEASASTTIVVAHAGVIRAIICLAEGLPLKRAFEIAVDYGTITATLLSHGAEELRVRR